MSERLAQLEQVVMQQNAELASLRQQLAAEKAENERWRKAMPKETEDYGNEQWAYGWNACVEAMEKAVK